MEKLRTTCKENYNNRPALHSGVTDEHRLCVCEVSILIRQLTTVDHL